MAEALTVNLRPRPNTKTGRVWEIADEITRKSGHLASRAAVMNAFAEEGGNSNTASTQYSHWKADRQRRTTAAPSEEANPRRKAVLHIGSDGRLLIPLEFRSQMALDKDGQVSARIEDGELRLISPKQALMRLQRMVRDLDLGKDSVVDELIAERRVEARSE